MRARLVGRARRPRPGTVGSDAVTSLRDSFERASEPALTRLNRLPRAVPFLVVLALVVAGVLVPGWGWVFLTAVSVVLLWFLVLAWPRLVVAERMMRLAVLVMMAAVTVTQVFPRG
ncbi:MAG: DUF6703 family protein [Dermatophilaceae bacterium]